MFERILLATSATEACDHAARVAFNMAGRYNSYLNIFHVLGLPTRAYSQIVIDVKSRERVTPDEEYIAWVRDEIRGYYEHLLEKTRDNYGIEVAVGTPHREILRAARNNSPDLIVMGGSTGHLEDSAYKKTVTGSTFQRVAKGVHCPVLVVTRPAASFWGGFSRVVLGTDFSEASDIAFDYALQLSRALDCELFLFHAVDISAMAMGKIMPQDDIEENLRVARRRMRSRYVPKMADFENYTMDAWEGLPYVEISKYAREKQADLLIMAHHARRDASGEGSMGSTMEQVIVRASCPVLSINRNVKKQ